MAGHSETSVVDLGTAPALGELDDPPAGLAGLMATLFSRTRSVSVRRVAPSTYLAFLPGPEGLSGTALRLVGADKVPYAERVTRVIDTAVMANGDGPARVLLVGHAQGGPTALDVAAMAESPHFDVDRVVTAGAPTAAVPRVPRRTGMISLEDRSGTAAVLASLVNAGANNRLSLVFDMDGATTPAERYLAGARLADASTHPDLVRELAALRELGYLA